MLRCLLFRCFIVVFLVLPCWSQGSHSAKVLVLLEDAAIKNTHSAYFNTLALSGFDLTFRRVDDRNLRLREWDTWLYDKLVLFAANVPGAIASSVHC